MDKPLLINWQDDFLQGAALIDEQHRAVTATINSFHYFLNQGQDVETLMPTVNILISYLRFHMTTEEGILRAADYPNLEQYIESSHEAIKGLREGCQRAIDEQDPSRVLLFLKEWWRLHLEMHDELLPYITLSDGEYCRLDQKP